MKSIWEMYSNGELDDTLIASIQSAVDSYMDEYPRVDCDSLEGVVIDSIVDSQNTWGVSEWPKELRDCIENDPGDAEDLVRDVVSDYYDDNNLEYAWMEDYVTDELIPMIYNELEDFGIADCTLEFDGTHYLNCSIYGDNGDYDYEYDLDSLDLREEDIEDDVFSIARELSEQYESEDSNY